MTHLISSFKLSQFLESASSFFKLQLLYIHIYVYIYVVVAHIYIYIYIYIYMEKEMATHSSILAWRIQGMEEPGGLPSMGSHRVGHD